MPKLTAESAKHAIRQMPTDRFSFEDLRVLFSVDYENLREVLFELLGEPQPAITQMFDPQAKTMCFVRGSA